MAEEFLGIVQDLLEAQPAWGVAFSTIFVKSMQDMMATFPDLPAKLARFLELKRQDPLRNRYGKRDSGLTGFLEGFFHCHLRDDAVLIYKLDQNRTILLVLLTPHAELEKKNARRVGAQVDPYRSQAGTRIRPSDSDLASLTAAQKLRQMR